MPKVKSPYEQGYEAAVVPLPDQKPNPYPVDTDAYREWQEGHDDGSEDYIRWANSDA